MALKILFLGAPGVGKGTFAKRIAPALGITHFSAGDCLREQVKRETDIGNLAVSFLKKGSLVPGDLVVRMMNAKVAELQSNMRSYKGYLLDGFPRLLEQAELWDSTGDGPPQLVVNITLDEAVLLKKISSRRICQSCGDNYNLADIRNRGYDMPPMLPKSPGICDSCGGVLVQREDDKEDIVRRRLDLHNKTHGSLIDYYRDRSNILDFEVTRGVSQTDELLSLIKSRL